MSLHTGNSPVFFRAQDGYLPYPKGLPPATLPDDFIISNHDLATLCTVLVSFCSTINLSIEAHGRIPWVLVYNTMTSVMYRLVDMQLNAESLDEALRLGLLAFCSRIFMQGQTGTLAHADLSRRHSLSLQYLAGSPDITWRLHIWLLMMTCLSNGEHEGDDRVMCELRSKLRDHKIESWMEVREVMQSVLWITVVFDRRGKHFFETILQQENRLRIEASA
jgi:hypothetical protein